MTDQFWVDPEGLGNAAGGFTSAADSIAKRRARIAELIDPARVRAAAGDDRAGRAFADAIIQAGGQLHAGVKAWEDAVRQTGGSLTDLGRAFGAVENNATESVNALRR